MLNFFPKVTLVLLALIAMLLGSHAFAQSQLNWPIKPIRIIVPFTPGAFTDSSARLLARELAEQLGQQVVVENKTGASGVIGVDFVAKAAPDGYTLLVAETSFAMTPALKPNLPFDPLRDLVAISQIADATAVLMVREGLPVKSMKDLIALAKSKPNELSYGTAGAGSSSHLPIEHLLNLTSTQMLHVPFKGAAASLPELMAGRIDLVMSSVATGGPHIKAGKVRPLAVTGTQRSAVLPDTPTFAEAGYADYRMSYWFGVFAPSSTPPEIVARLEREIARAMTSSRLREAFAQQGALPIGSSSADFTRFVAEQLKTWKQVVTVANIKVD
jgi:tripartite-type tricarboxylate transporter receptor subunit TctC